MKYNSSSFGLLCRSRVCLCLLIGCAVTLILTFIKALLVVTINPLSVLGDTPDRLSALLSLPAHNPLYLLFPLCECLLVSGGAFFALKPLALYRYLRVVHQEQLTYHNLYIPVTTSIHIAGAGQAPALPLRSEQPGDDLLPSSGQRQQISLVEILRQRERHLFLLGGPGTGKTTALRVYHYLIAQPSLAFVLAPANLPIYVSLKDYGLFLKNRHTSSIKNEASPYNWFFQYLAGSNLPGMPLLRPYLLSLLEQGKLLLLCDGFDEIDRDDRSLVVDELAFLMRHTTNHLVITCREMDYQEQDAFVQLVDGGDATRALLYPIQFDLVYELVEKFVERQDKRWRYTAGQVLQLIDRSRLRYHSSNLMMIMALLNTISRVGIERAKQIDTRGSLLRDYVVQLFESESRQSQWLRDAPAKQEVCQFLSALACAIYWTNSCGALQLPIAALPSLQDRRRKLNFAELADAVGAWLDEHPPQLPFETEDVEPLVPDGDCARLLQFALSAALIEVTADGVLSFSHELLASYFVAEYFFAATRELPMTTLAIRLDFLENIEHWCQPIALWAGLLERPLELAERFGALALLNDRTFLPYAVSLGLICVGVVSTPPQADVQRSIILPPDLETSLLFATHDRPMCEDLANAVTLCAEVGSQEAYYALLPLVTTEGVDVLLTLLDYHTVPEMLFQHLEDAVDQPDHEVQIKRITRVLSQFGSPVIDRAAQLSLPAPERSSRLRAATINILGGTYDLQAVEPLIELLRDPEPVVVERAAHALFRLGPGLALASMLAALEDRTPDVFTLRLHRAILRVLRRFMEEQDARRQVSSAQYQQIVDHVLAILTPRYRFEPEVQLQARSLLVDQGRMVSMPDTELSHQQSQYVVDALVSSLSTQDDDAIQEMLVALQEIGPRATPRLIASLQHHSELVRVRVIEVMQSVRDLSVLPALLGMVDDPVPAVRQQVAVALHSFAPESISHLLELLLMSPSESQAEAATQILASIGNSVVDPVISVLFQAPPARACLLVDVLEKIHDSRAVPALIALQEQSQAEPLLAIALVQALGQFREKQVVAPLIDQVASTNPQLYEEAVIALSQLGEIALPELLAALDTDQDIAVKQRIQRAILGMSPFPSEQLVHALEQSSKALTMQLEAIFVQQGSDAAFVLTKYLLHPNERVRGHIHQALGRMQDAFVVPALLDALSVEALREIAGTFLLKYPSVAIPLLVDLLGEPERGNVAATILPQFGSMILRPLIAALEDQRAMTRELACRIIIMLVRQSSDQQAVLREVVQLFLPPLPENSHNQLLDLLTNELADVSLSALLVSLEDAHLVEPVTDALSLMAQRQDRQGEVIDNLLEALFVAEQRHGSERAFIKIGAPAVNPVGRLITAENAEVAKAAKRILCDIGVSALPFIWMAHTDRSDLQRRDAAMEIFRSMSADVIKDELVTLLVSDKRDDISMAVSLLLERVHEESRQDDHVMVPELIEYIQLHHMDVTNLRIIALLLLLGEQAFFDHLLNALAETSQPHKQLLYIFLFLSDKRLRLILDTFEDPDTASGLRAELATVLGLLKAPRIITDYARRVSIYGLVKNPKQLASPEKLAISLRALGSLLASGQWDARRLLEMRDTCGRDDPARELFNVLLGWRYEPLIAQVREEMEDQRETFRKKTLLLTEKIMEEQKRAQGLETNLEKLKEEHERRGEELEKVGRDRDNLRTSMSKLSKENTDLRSNLEQTTKAKNTLSAQLERLKKEYAALQKPQQPAKPSQ